MPWESSQQCGGTLENGDCKMGHPFKKKVDFANYRSGNGKGSPTKFSNES